MATPTLADIAAALYAAAPEEFVAARNRRAAEADAALAAEIRRLRKPSIAAWVVNVFAHERAGQLDEALELAAELRGAQEDLDAAALAKLGRERRALTRRLAVAATDLASARGERITPATIEAVEQTISAAFFDPDAARAVSSGRLVRAIEPSSSPDEVRDAVAGDLPETGAAPPQPPDELEARRRRRDAERRVAAARKDLTAAEHDLAARTASLATQRASATELAEEANALEERLAWVRRERTRIEDRLAESEAALGEAADVVEAARAAVAEAEEALSER